MGGFDYMQYIVPGPDHDGGDQNAYGNVVSSFFGAKFGRHIEELLVAPMPNWVIVLGYVAGGVMRGLLVGVIVTGGRAVLHAACTSQHPFVIVAVRAADLGRVLARRLRQRGVREELRRDLDRSRPSS